MDFIVKLRVAAASREAAQTVAELFVSSFKETGYNELFAENAELVSVDAEEALN